MKFKSNIFVSFEWLGVVVKGFDLGVASMKKGEKAVLTFAPEYAYGASGSPPNIPPNATLTFEVSHNGAKAISREIFLNLSFSALSCFFNPSLIHFHILKIDWVVRLEARRFEPRC